MQMKKSTKDWELFSTPAHFINRAARLFARVGEGRLRALGFGVGQLPVLAMLKGGATLPQKELARLAHIEQPSMAQTLARMERDGMIRRAPDPADGRSTLISLTAQAESRLPAARRVLFQGNDEALRGFDQAEIATLTALLQRVVTNLEAAAEDSSA